VEAEAHETHDSFAPPNQFSADYLLPPLDEGDSHFILVRPQGDTILTLQAVLDDEEEAALRVWDVNNRELIRDVEGEGDFSTTTSALFQGTFAIEVEAITDIEDDFDLFITGEEIMLGGGSQFYDPPLFLDSNGDIDEGTVSSTIDVTGCPNIADISVTTFFDTNLSPNFIRIELFPPYSSTPIMLNDDVTGSEPLNTTYPDESEPVDSFDAVAGNDGNGAWTIVAGSRANVTDADFEGWILELTCTDD
jgi:hypothetical protein